MGTVKHGFFANLEHVCTKYHVPNLKAVHRQTHPNWKQREHYQGFRSSLHQPIIKEQSNFPKKSYAHVGYNLNHLTRGLLDLTTKSCQSYMIIIYVVTIEYAVRASDYCAFWVSNILLSSVLFPLLSISCMIWYDSFYVVFFDPF